MAVALGCQSAQIGAIVLVLMSTMVAGGYPPLSTLRGPARAVANLSMQRWALEGFFLLELHGMGYREDYVKPEACMLPSHASMRTGLNPCPESQAVKLGYNWGNQNFDLAMILASGGTLRLLAWLLMFALGRDRTK